METKLYELEDRIAIASEVEEEDTATMPKLNLPTSATKTPRANDFSPSPRARDRDFPPLPLDASDQIFATYNFLKDEVLRYKKLLFAHVKGTSPQVEEMLNQNYVSYNSRISDLERFAAQGGEERANLSDNLLKAFKNFKMVEKVLQDRMKIKIKLESPDEEGEAFVVPMERRGSRRPTAAGISPLASAVKSPPHAESSFGPIQTQPTVPTPTQQSQTYILYYVYLHAALTSSRKGSQEFMLHKKILKKFSRMSNLIGIYAILSLIKKTLKALKQAIKMSLNRYQPKYLNVLISS
jgi:hypothetical protein